MSVFPVFNLTFKSLNMMKPSPQSQRFIYENQTSSAISDQTQQPSGQGYQGRTGKAINCQSLHRSTNQSTTSLLPPPPLAHRHTGTLHQLLLYCRHMHEHKAWFFCTTWLYHLVGFVPFLLKSSYLLNYLESRLQDQHFAQFR